MPIITKVPSDSRPGEFHYIGIDQHEELYCTCEQYNYCAELPRTCHHLRDLGPIGPEMMRMFRVIRALRGLVSETNRHLSLKATQAMIEAKAALAEIDNHILRP